MNGGGNIRRRAAGVGRRLWRGRRRGVAMFETLLAFLLFAILLTGGTVWLDARQKSDLAAEAGRVIAVLGDAVEHYVQSTYPVRIASIGTGQQVTVAALQTDGILPETFEAVDTMKRDMAVLMLPIQEGTPPVTVGVRALSGQVRLPTEDTRRPYRALLQGRGGQAMGMVERGGRCSSASLLPPCLIGPMVGMSVVDFHLRWPGMIDEGAVFSVYEFRHQDYCGDMVHRLPVPAGICPDSATMELDLDMNGNDIQGAGDIRAQRMEVADEVDVARNMTVRGAMVVDNNLDVAGSLTANTLEVLEVGNIEGRLELLAGGSMSVSGEVDATALTVTGELRAGTATIEGDATMGALFTDDIRANRDAEFNWITVGSCSGC